MSNKEDDKMLSTSMHKWTLYIHLWDKKKDISTYTMVKQFTGNWTTIHKRFQLFAKLLDFTTCKRDSTLVGYYYARKGGDCLICLPDILNPERIYD